MGAGGQRGAQAEGIDDGDGPQFAKEQLLGGGRPCSELFSGGDRDALQPKQHGVGRKLVNRPDRKRGDVDAGREDQAELGAVGEATGTRVACGGTIGVAARAEAATGTHLGKPARNEASLRARWSSPRSPGPTPAPTGRRRAAASSLPLSTPDCDDERIAGAARQVRDRGASLDRCSIDAS